MSYLDKLKNNSKSNLQKIAEASTSAGQNTKRNDDDGVWKYELNKNGVASAVLRFLPIPEVDSTDEKALPWVSVTSFAFKEPETGLWYIEKSLRTIGKEDPVQNEQNRLYTLGQNGDKEAEEANKRRRRKVQYYSNVYVVEDPANPENEGKVFLFRYGKKIFDKLMSLINVDESLGETPVDPFNLMEGVNFRLKVKKVDGYPNYDASSFSDPVAISNKAGKPLTDDQIEEVLGSMTSLLAFLDEKNFKSFEELQKRFDKVRGMEDEGIMSSPKDRLEKNKRKVEEDEDDDDDDLPPFDTDKKTTSTPSKGRDVEDEDSDDDDLDFESLLDSFNEK